MKNLAKYLLLLLFIVAVPAKADGPARWVARDHDTTLHIYGTIHVLRPDLKWQTPKMLADFNASDRIIFELAPDQVTPAVIQPLILSQGIFGLEDSLTNYLSEEDYNILFGYLTSVGIPAQNIPKMKPWYATLTLAQVIFTKAGFSGEIGVEKSLVAKANDNGQEIMGLESLADQVGYFANMPLDKQANFLKSSLDEMHEATAQLDKMLNVWVKGDIEGTAALINEGMEDLPEIYDVLIVKRNIKWVKQINQIMQQEGIFFMAVGAGHMAGEEGVIKLLEKEGYEVRRVE